MEIDLVISQINLGCAVFKGCIAVAYDRVTLTCAAYRLLHNLLHKHSTGRHTLSCTVRVISAFGRAYYSTGRSLMSLRLQNHTSHLSLTFFLSSKNWLPVFIVFSFSLWRCRNPGGRAKNKPRSGRERSLCACTGNRHTPAHMHAYFAHTQYPDVKWVCVLCACAWVCLMCDVYGMYSACCQVIKSRLPGPDLMCPATAPCMCACQAPVSPFLLLYKVVYIHKL